MRISQLLALAAFIICSQLSLGAVTWTGAALDGDWGNPANWTGGVPTAADDVIFAPVGGAVVAVPAVINLGGNRDVKSITINTGTPNFNLDTAGSTNTLTVHSGVIAGNNTTSTWNMKVVIPSPTATLSQTTNSGLITYNNSFTFTGTLYYNDIGNFGRHHFAVDNTATMSADIVYNGGVNGGDIFAVTNGLGSPVGRTITWLGGTATTITAAGNAVVAHDIILGTENGGNHSAKTNANLALTGNISGAGHLQKNALTGGHLMLTGDNRGWTGNLIVNSMGTVALSNPTFPFTNSSFPRMVIADGPYSLGSGNVIINTNGGLAVKQDTTLYGTLSISAGPGSIVTGDGNGQILVADGKVLTVESLIINGIVFPNGTYSRNSVYNGIVLADYWPTSTVNGFTLGTGLIKVPEPTCALLLAALPLLRRRRA